MHYIIRGKYFSKDSTHEFYEYTLICYNWRRLTAIWNANIKKVQRIKILQIIVCVSKLYLILFI